ncbi:LysM peptidoglycan-binding domain-containing protein [Proteinivorax tanatarense]|uniref:LysM peptidoglycan-binding domain-containing protein n=1 Tax=Proteinivorax tanatarense TaxID=1260629 RepID=A0AAU7VJA1_9FIRM
MDSRKEMYEYGQQDEKTGPRKKGKKGANEETQVGAGSVSGKFGEIIKNHNHLFHFHFFAPNHLIGLPTVGTTCRIPTTCPAGFEGRYIVKTGDSMYFIAQRCGVSVQALINANPHISNPNVIYPCDVLCVPPRCADFIGDDPNFCNCSK